MTDVFAQLDSSFQQGGLAAALDAAESAFRQQERFHELFEVLKMQSRLKLGLPLVHQDDDARLSESDQRALEDGLISACKDVGLKLLRANQVQDGWFYLRHLTDRGFILEELRRLDIDEDNLEQIIGILLHEGLDTEHGYRLVLQHYGTCNAITTIQSTLYGRSKRERQAAARLLVAHVHDEVLQNVKSHIDREEGSIPAENRLDRLIEKRDYLFQDGAYHIDTSHLSSTVQVSTELMDTESLELALDLTRYGRRLDPALQYASDPPFEETYVAHGKFFASQLGETAKEGIDFFRQRAEQTDAHQDGTFPIEVYIDLLARVGQLDKAIDASIELIPAGTQTTGRGPSLFELSEQLGDFSRYRAVCQQRSDPLGYLVSLGRNQKTA